MTFLQIINLIKDTASAQPNVNTVVRQFVDLNREDTVYSAVVLQDRDGSRDRIGGQDWNTYTFHLGYVDRLTYDESDRDDIFSTGINIINNIVASIREVWWPDVEVDIIDRFQTFDQRFTASCAGVYVVLSVQVPVSDCVDSSEGDIFDNFSVNISNNGHYHYVPDGRPYGGLDITVSVGNQKPEDSLKETITSNGSYHYVPEEGRVYGELDITVSVGAPTGFTEKEITEEGVQISNLNNSASYVASRAFLGNTYLQTVYLPNCTRISENAFESCSSLTNADLPNVTYIEGYAFANCTKLESISLPNCEEICGAAFKGCGSLSSLVLPKCSKISGYAFPSAGLRTITLGSNKVVNAGNSALYGLSDLSAVYVPASLVDAYKSAYYWSEYSSMIFPISE